MPILQVRDTAKHFKMHFMFYDIPFYLSAIYYPEIFYIIILI